MANPTSGQLPPGSGNPLTRVLGSVLEVGKDILARRGLASANGDISTDNLVDMCRKLIQHRGEASGLALANEIGGALLKLTTSDKLDFFNFLASDFEVDPQAVIDAARRYGDKPDFEHLNAISKAVEAPRQKLFRRINMAPGGTSTLVSLRSDLLRATRDHPHLKPVDSDLKHLFISWFNKGFLKMERIDWNSPARVLEKIIDYEAVHEINGWDDLRSRLQEDRLCYAFFHPAMPDDPLVFVEVALTNQVADAITPLLRQDRDYLPARSQNTAVFYSISNCHEGLGGISFGNFLIKQVVEELHKEHGGIKTFVTLSPVPGFRNWLLKARLDELIEPELMEAVRAPITEVVPVPVKEALIRLCAHYLINVKSGTLAKDPVARFHLGNGARLHRLNWAADLSPKGKEQSSGIMVNYLYDLDKIEINHDDYFDQGVISVSKTVSKLL